MNGIINLLKPPAMSSGQAVGAIRKTLGIRKVGHTGTLDPGAAGVLPVCVGRATKIADYIMQGDKEYIAEMTVGCATDTLDSYGMIVERSAKSIQRTELEVILSNFTGEILQTPPAYSALKQNGIPLYKLARQGNMVQKPPRQVQIHEIEILDGEKDCFLIRIRCSKGTYIRSLIADIARAAGGLAYTSLLIRTQTGGFSLEKAVTLNELDEKALIPMEEALTFLERLELNSYLFDIVRTGSPVDIAKANIDVCKGTDYAVYCDGSLIGIGRRVDAYLKIVTMLYMA